MLEKSRKSVKLFFLSDFLRIFAREINHATRFLTAFSRKAFLHYLSIQQELQNKDESC